MPPSSLQQRRTHNLLLISKVLNQRDAASPFTLVLDSLEQSGKPLLEECVRRANVSRTQVICVSFETLQKPPNADVFIEAWRQSLQSWQKEVSNYVKDEPGRKKLLIFDSLSTLADTQAASLPALLSSFIGPSTSLLALYHTDVPLLSRQEDAYSPSALTLLRYLATTILTTHSIHHVLARKAARDRSYAEPTFGLETGVEGVVQALGANGPNGFVLEMQHRRKSGRGVTEWYYFERGDQRQVAKDAPIRSREAITLLEDHPQYRSREGEHGEGKEAEAEVDTTFELGLTDKQRRDREGVVLPYFDAQKGDVEGGKILYDMGSEDDFDEEEDEI